MHELLTAPARGEAQQAALGKLAALQGVRRFPSRIKCAMLAWRALDRAWTTRPRRPATRRTRMHASRREPIEVRRTVRALRCLPATR